MTDAASIDSQSTPICRWQPLEAVDRRVLGVLIEKAKTTPDNYPLSLNSLRGGCNQKSNRFPQMDLDDDTVGESLERLRNLRAVCEIQGGSRVDKFRHLAYEWLGVDKVELAVMAELLLRGAQTVGELRGRAARMEPIKGSDELRPILDQLESKGLLIYLSPKGRGALVTHALYQPRELEKVRREFADGPAVELSSDVAPPIPRVAEAPPASGTAGARESVPPDIVEEVRQLSSELTSLRRDFEQAVSDLNAASKSLQCELDELNRQLGN